MPEPMLVVRARFGMLTADVPLSLYCPYFSMLGAHGSFQVPKSVLFFRYSQLGNIEEAAAEAESGISRAFQAPAIREVPSARVRLAEKQLTIPSRMSVRARKSGRRTRAASGVCM